MLKSKGDTWNESEVYKDPWTYRNVRRLTTSGDYNEKPTYHTNTTFSEDGQWIIFARGHEGRSALFKGNTKTGEITQLTEPANGVGGRGVFINAAACQNGLTATESTGYGLASRRKN